MKAKPQLTNEKISKKFRNQFDLVNYAIQIANEMVISGRKPRVKSETENTALNVIAEIMSDKDKLDAEINTTDVEINKISVEEKRVELK